MIWRDQSAKIPVTVQSNRTTIRQKVPPRITSDASLFPPPSPIEGLSSRNSHYVISRRRVKFACSLSLFFSFECRTGNLDFYPSPSVALKITDDRAVPPRTARRMPLPPSHPVGDSGAVLCRVHAALGLITHLGFARHQVCAPACLLE